MWCVPQLTLWSRRPLSRRSLEPCYRFHFVLIFNGLNVGTSCRIKVRQADEKTRPAICWKVHGKTFLHRRPHHHDLTPGPCPKAIYPPPPPTPPPNYHWNMFESHSSYGNKTCNIRSHVQSRLVQFEKTRREVGRRQPTYRLVFSNCISIGSTFYGLDNQVV